MGNHCLRCGVALDTVSGMSLSEQYKSAELDEYQQTFIRVHYKDSLCPECIRHVKESFYAFDISPRYLKKKKFQD